MMFRHLAFAGIDWMNCNATYGSSTWLNLDI